MIRDPRFHRRGDPQRLMNPAEVVVHEVQRDRRDMVLDLLAEGVSEPGEAAHAHSQGEVAALHDGSADTFGIGLPHDWDHLHGGDFGGAVARFAVARGAVDLDELCEIAAVVQRGGDRGSVRSETIGRHLEFAARRVPYAFDELVSRGLVALSHSDVQHQLVMPLDCDEDVTVTEVLIVFGAHALFLLADEGPNFVGFHIAHWNVDYPLRHDLLAFLTSEHQQLHDRVLVETANPHRAANAVAFDEELYSEQHLFFGDIHCSKGEPMGFREGALALRALKAAQAITMLAELLAVDTAVRATDLTGFCFALHTSIIQRAVAV